jgi:eukaryotic-like serine/threonine-protein kinase
MALSPGTRLGPYEILSPCGAGGMGEVYRAKDTRLDRTVAVKILPTHLSENADLRQRFEREARAVSSLNHAHICTLHDIGHQDGVDFLVLEYLEGETLADRLRKGPIPPDQFARTAIEIADALDRAHRQGVIHRDLKPSNIMLTKGGVKLLDFGLAKLSDPHPPESLSRLSALPTEDKSPLTAEGTIVGTLQYMAPEQLEGREADARTDIFALGTVLYEMATGQRAFKGKSQASLIAAILASEPPPISSLRPMTPPALDRLVRTCLAKDPDDRWQSAGDLARELEWIAHDGSQVGPAPAGSALRARRESIWIAATVLLGLTVVVLGFLDRRSGRSDQREVVRASIEAPAGNRFVSTSDVAGPPAISPDGRSLVYGAMEESGTRRLWLRRLDTNDARPLTGTDNPTWPFWSPDSRSVAFFSGGKLRRLDVSGGLPDAICSTGDGRGGAWSRDGTIVFSPTFRAGLLRVPASGGDTTPLTRLDEATHSSHRWPQPLPDGRHFLYLAISHDPTKAENDALYWASLDGRENRMLLRSLANAIYASGHLLYLRDTNLVAQPFDPDRGELRGEPVTVASGVEYDQTTWRATFTVSDTGVLVYRPGAAAAGTILRWVDAAGKEIGTVGEPDLYRDLRISPDGKRLAVSRGDPPDIWIYDLIRGVGSRFTFEPGTNEFRPTWSPDGHHVAFTSDRGGQGAIYIKESSGSAAEELLQQSSEPQRVTDWSSDGRFVLYEQGDASKRSVEIWAVPLSGDRRPFPVVQEPSRGEYGRLSPDGAWVAYDSDESGIYQVYVTRFGPPSPAGRHPPAGAGKWQVSGRGGDLPTWRGDGRVLFFIGLDNQMMAVDVQRRGDSLEIGAPRPLFSEPFPGVGVPYDVSRDGRRFIVYAGQESTSTPLSLVLHWDARLKR